MAEENGRAEERSEARSEVTGSRESPVLLRVAPPIGAQHATNSICAQQTGATVAQRDSLKALALKVLARNKQAQQARNNVVPQPSKTERDSLRNDAVSSQSDPGSNEGSSEVVEARQQPSNGASATPGPPRTQPMFPGWTDPDGKPYALPDEYTPKRKKKR